ncbi:MAG: putative glycosyl transferase domain [Pseudomonadota bacterium]|jgi:GT2 family glycosyltransferase
MVLDDASPDHTRQMMRDEFPDILHIRMPSNMGQVFARNLGVTSTAGDYVLSLDDDAWFESPDGLARAIAIMDADSRIGALALNVRLPNGWLFLPRGMAARDMNSYIGCGVLLRREVAEKTLYIPEMMGAGEESDRSLRIYDLGYSVRGAPDIVVYHELSLLNRNWRRYRFMNHRNSLIRELARCPLALLPWRFLRVWLGNTWFNLRDGYFLLDLQMLFHLPAILNIGLRRRRPVSLAAYRRWRAITAQDRAELPGGQGPADYKGTQPA